MMLFIKKHWKLLLTLFSFAALFIAGFVASRLGVKDLIPMPSAPDMKNEIRAIQAEAEVKKIEAKLGHEHAVQKVEEEHAEALAALDAAQKKQAEELRADPSKLAAFLVRAGKG